MAHVFCMCMRVQMKYECLSLSVSYGHIVRGYQACLEHCMPPQYAQIAPVLLNLCFCQDDTGKYKNYINLVRDYNRILG